jgi:hypothetical protein
MRRLFPTLALSALIAMAAPLNLAGCSGNVAATPSVASVNFTPKAEIVVDRQGQLVVASDSNRTDPITLTTGSVVTITNRSGQDQRVTGTLDGKASIDTGGLHDGESVTVVLGTSGAVELRANTDGSGAALTISVVPRTS